MSAPLSQGVTSAGSSRWVRTWPGYRVRKCGIYFLSRYLISSRGSGRFGAHAVASPRDAPTRSY